MSEGTLHPAAATNVDRQFDAVPLSPEATAFNSSGAPPVKKAACEGAVFAWQVTAGDCHRSGEHPFCSPATLRLRYRLGRDAKEKGLTQRRWKTR